MMDFVKRMNGKSESGFMGTEGLGTYLFYAIMTGAVLGIMYLLFSGSKLTETQQAIFAIRMNVQQTFTSSLDYTGLSNDYVMKAGLAPKKLIKGGALLNSWGGSLTVAAGDDTGTFTITLAGVPQEDCTKLATYQLETWLNLEVNNTAISKDSAVVEAADACQGSNTIVYTAR